MSKITYFVSGYMRCGTSMMMDALTAGGLEPAFNPDRNEMNTQFGDEDYKPNPNGFYELSNKEYSTTGFPRQYEGRLIKLLFGGINRIVAGKYNIVFMRRDYEEIRQSYEGFFSRPILLTREELEEKLNDAVGILKQRRDVNIVEINYRDVVDNPKKIFEELVDRGWEINIDPAVKIIDPTLLRFKKELLEEGI